MGTSTISIPKKVAFILVFVLLTGISYGAIFTATTSGNFSSSTTWAGGLVPPTLVTLDVIVISPGVTVNLDNNLTINGLTAQLNVQGSLTTSNNSSLTLSVCTLMGAGTIALNTIDVNAGAVFLFTGSMTANTLNCNNGLMASADIVANQSLHLNSGTLSLVAGGSLDIGADATIYISGGLLSVGAGGTADLTGNYNVTYTNSSCLSGVELSGSGLVDVNVNVNPGNSVTLTADLAVEGTLSLSSGTLVLATNDLTLNGDVAASGSATISSTAASNININCLGGTIGIIAFGEGTSACNTLTVNVGAGNHARIGGNVTVNAMLQLNTGILDCHNTDLTISGNISGSGQLSGNNSTNLSVNTAGGLSAALNFAAGGQTCHNLSLSVGSGNSVSIGSDLTVEGTLALTGGSNCNLNGHSLTLGLASNISGTGSLLCTPASNLTINSSAGISLLVLSGIIGNLTENCGGSSVMLGSDVTIAGTLNLQSGSCVLNGHDLTINGNIAASGTGTISSDETCDITIATPSSPSGPCNFSPGGNTVGKLTINIGNNGSVSVGTHLQIKTNLHFINGKLNIGANALIIDPVCTITGTGITSYIMTTIGGYVERDCQAGGSPVHFPVGTISNFTPVNCLLNPGSPSGHVQVGVITDVMAEGTAGADLSATQPCVDGTWYVNSNISGNLDMNVQVMWPAAIEVNGFNRNDCFISHYINGNWDASVRVAATAEANGMFSLQRTGITSLSPFAVFDQTTITAVEDINITGKISVFPNPATDKITIQNTMPLTEPMNLNIYSSTGQLIGQYRLNVSTSTISLQGLMNGNYFIRVFNKHLSGSRQFTKI